MKKHLFFVLFGLMTVSVMAQDRIILLRDTTRLGISVAELEKKYPPALARSTGREGVFGQSKQMFIDTTQAVSQRFISYIQRNKKRLPPIIFMLQTQEFVRPDGTYDRVLCDFSGRDLTDQQESRLLQFVAEWYGQHSFPIKTETGFRQISAITVSLIPEKRTVRSGPGIISTLEVAERTTRPDTVTMLAFAQLDLTTVPEVVYRFPKLEELELSRNKLHELPARLTADIPTLKRLSITGNKIPEDSMYFTKNRHLIALNLQGNGLTNIPKSVRRNRRLASLWMGNNKLTALANKSFRGLRRLTDLNLYSADLKQLPRTIGRLKRLKVLDMYYNKFTELPRPISRLKHLEQLAVAHNNLSALPASLGRLRNLQVVFAHHNRISQLPADFNKLQHLRVLDLGFNWFTVLPNVLGSLPALEELDVNNNNLQEFPTMLLSIKTLKKVCMGSNPLFGREAMSSPYAPQIKQLEANNTQVKY